MLASGNRGKEIRLKAEMQWLKQQPCLQSRPHSGARQSPSWAIYLWRPREGISRGHEVFSQQALWMTICGYRKSAITGNRRKQGTVKSLHYLKGLRRKGRKPESHCKVGCGYKSDITNYRRRSFWKAAFQIHLVTLKRLGHKCPRVASPDQWVSSELRIMSSITFQIQLTYN